MLTILLTLFVLGADSEVAKNYVVPDPAPLMTEARLAEMAQGEILVLKQDTASKGKGTAGSGLAMTLIDAPVDAVWGYLVDFEKQPEYMPRIETAVAYSEDGNETGIKQTVKVAWKTVIYHILETRDKENYILRWRLDHSKENDIAETVGSWQLVPYQETKTVAIYSLNVDSGMRVPKFIENFLMTRDLPGLLEALKLRSESGGTYKR